MFVNSSKVLHEDSTQKCEVCHTYREFEQKATLEKGLKEVQTDQYLLKQTVTTNNFDIFTVTESWLNRTVCDADILILGYTTFRQDRGPRKRGGGVLVYVKDIYKACVIEKWSSVSESNFQQLWLKVQCKKFKSFFLCTVYRPPDALIDFLENLSDSLLHGSNAIILGDLNCNLIGGDPDGHALSDFCSTFGLSQLVKTATRVTEKSSHL